MKKVKEKDILLIDDLYTYSVNVDEDAIQALYDKGANSVIFYSIGAAKLDFRQSKTTLKLKRKYSDNAINIITTKSFKGIGRAWINKNLKGNESVERIVALINKNSKQGCEITIEEFVKRKNEIINQLKRLEEFCDGIVYWR